MALYRDFQATGKRQPAALDADGRFVLGDPAMGPDRHRAQNQVHVSGESAAIDLIGKGFSLRVTTSTRPSLVRRNLFANGRRLT